MNDFIHLLEKHELQLLAWTAIVISLMNLLLFLCVLKSQFSLIHRIERVVGYANV